MLAEAAHCFPPVGNAEKHLNSEKHKRAACPWPFAAVPGFFIVLCSSRCVAFLQVHAVG